AFFVCSKHTHLSHVVLFFDINCRACFSLHFLNHLSTGSDHSANKFSVDKHLEHSWCVWFNIIASLAHAIVHSIQNMQSASLRLLQCLAHHVHRQTIDLYIHLHTTNSITCTGHFKVHIAEMVLVAKYIS